MPVATEETYLKDTPESRERAELLNQQTEEDGLGWKITRFETTPVVSF
jgi:hypothetical protein